MKNIRGKWRKVKDDKTKVQWDDCQVRSITPATFGLDFHRDEIVLLLGTEATEIPGNKGLVSKVLSRITMNPFTVKQLAHALNSVILECESRYGERDLYSSFASPSVSCEREDLLFQIIKGLDVEAGFERSFKVINGALLNKRFLLGVSKDAIGRSADERIIEACVLMGMPEALMDTFKQYLHQGNYVHFGFEQNGKSSIYKVYLEFFEEITKEIEKESRSPEPLLLHLGLKWDVMEPALQSLTRYTWYPWISSQEIMQRISHILEPDRGAAAIQAAEQIMSLARSRVPERDILYLEVTEEGNPRRSFDINVYRANLALAEMYPVLSMLCRRHSIPFDIFHSLYGGIKRKRFGHLAAGVDRAGKSFFTVYYGVEEKFGKGSTKKTQAVDMGAMASSGYSVEETDEKAALLYRMIEGFGTLAVVERSFKFLDRVLLSSRFLSGVRRQAPNEAQDEAIMNLCKRIEMPEDYQESFRTELREANIVLFGFEKNNKNSIYKVYLEFTDRLKQAISQDPMPESVVIHKGFKWDVSDNSRKVTALYKAFHILHAKDMAARLLRDFYENEKKNPFTIVDNILDLAGSRTRPGELLYFEASEEDNFRRSFDINMYLADLQIAELYPLLVDMARHYSIDLKDLDEMYKRVKDHKFGHLSGGSDREGRDFLTIYFSQKGSSQAMSRRRRSIAKAPDFEQEA